MNVESYLRDPEEEKLLRSMAKSDNDMRGVFLFSMGGGISAGVTAGGGMGTFEIGGIGKNGFYMTTTGSFGGNVGGGGLNIGGTVGGEKAAKAVFGAALGCWKNHVYVMSNSEKNGEIYDIGVGGPFMKLLFGNKTVNFDITNKLLFGGRRYLSYSEYDYYRNRYGNHYNSGFTTVWQISAGLTFTGKGGN
jgi:hypothetical protein